MAPLDNTISGKFGDVIWNKGKRKHNMPDPTITLDQALDAVKASEATLKADQNSVVNIQSSIATATAPLANAQATVSNDTAIYNSSIDTAIAVLTASKIPVV